MLIRSVLLPVITMNLVVRAEAVAECYTRRGDVDGALECLERFKVHFRGKGYDK